MPARAHTHTHTHIHTHKHTHTCRHGHALHAATLETNNMYQQKSKYINNAPIRSPTTHNLHAAARTRARRPRAARARTSTPQPRPRPPGTSRGCERCTANTNTKYTGQTPNKLLAQWVHLTSRRTCVASSASMAGSPKSGPPLVGVRNCAARSAEAQPNRRRRRCVSPTMSLPAHAVRQRRTTLQLLVQQLPGDNIDLQVQAIIQPIND
jgi:hypothetical protein